MPRPTAARSRYSLAAAALLTLAVFVALVLLGNWQMRRLEWKEDLIARATERPAGPVQDLPPPNTWADLNIADAEYQPFSLSGRFLHDREALVFTSLTDARGPYEGPGYWVVTPFALAGGGTVLVNRGFAPQGRHRASDRGEALSDAAVTQTGLLRPDDPPHLFTPDDKPQDNLFFARNVEAIAAAKALPPPVAPFTIDLLAAATPPGGLPQAGETRMAFTNNHLAYAFTWYGLAAALLAVFASFVWGRQDGGAEAPRLTPPGTTP